MYLFNPTTVKIGNVTWVVLRKESNLKFNNSVPNVVLKQYNGMKFIKSIKLTHNILTRGKLYKNKRSIYEDLKVIEGEYNSIHDVLFTSNEYFYDGKTKKARVAILKIDKQFHIVKESRLNLDNPNCNRDIEKNWGAIRVGDQLLMIVNVNPFTTLRYVNGQLSDLKVYKQNNIRPNNQICDLYKSGNINLSVTGNPISLGNNKYFMLAKQRLDGTVYIYYAVTFNMQNFAISDFKISKDIVFKGKVLFINSYRKEGDQIKFYAGVKDTSYKIISRTVQNLLSLQYDSIVI